MSFAKRSFDWRGFWADLLGGAGRELLELDDSEAARAALSGVNFMEAARRGHRGSESIDPLDDGRDPAVLPYEEEELDPLEQVESPEGKDGGSHDGGQSWREFARPSAGAPGLSPSKRPAPLSANPYDDLGSPVRLQLIQQHYLRRR